VGTVNSLKGKTPLGVATAACFGEVCRIQEFSYRETNEIQLGHVRHYERVDRSYKFSELPEY